MKTKRILSYLAGILFTFTFGCTGAGGCNEIQPPPAPMPPSQVLENGMQVRITHQGMENIKQIASDITLAQLDNIAFIPEFWVGSSDHRYGIDFCSIGCGVDLDNMEITMDVNDVTDDSNNIEQCRETVMAPSQCDELDLNIKTNIHVGFDIDVFFAGNNITDDCSIDLGFQNKQFNGTVALGLRTRPSDGQLRFDINSITDLDLSGLSVTLEDCIPVVDDFLNAMILDNIGQYIEMLQAFVGDAVVQWVANNIIIPILQPTLDKLFPDPMGLVAAMNLKPYMTDAGWLTDDATLEISMISGGYVDIHNGGLTAGIITGFNSDADPSTRSDMADDYGVKEFADHARCVPPMATLDLSKSGVAHVPSISGADPDRVERYKRDIIDEFNGQYDQAYLMFSDESQADVGIAVTREMLDLLGFHLVNSGAMCLTMGIEHNPLLTVGSFAILLPSLSELIDPAVGDAPLRMVLRPQTPIQFSIGNGESDALIDMYMQDLRLDVYPYVKGRYTRAITFILSMHIPMDLEEGLDEQGNITVVPVLRSVDAASIQADVANSDLVREDPEQIKQILPSIVGMLMPLLAGAVEPIPLPSYEVERMNSQGQTMPWKVIKLTNLEFKPNLTKDALIILSKMEETLPGQKRLEHPFGFTAEIEKAETYSPEVLRAALAGADSRRPYVRVRTSREGEYQYRLDGGAWHAFVRGSGLTITDPALFIQGRHTLEIRGRAVGRPQTLNLEPVRLEVVMDSVAPLLYAKVYSDRIELGAHDYVSKDSELTMSWSTDGKNWTSWQNTATIKIPRDTSKVYVRAADAQGNISERVFTFDTAKSDDSGCSTSGGDPSLPLAILFALFLAWFMSKRRNHAKLFTFFLVTLVGAAVVSGCADTSSSKDEDEGMCMNDVDCAGLSCPDGQAPMCMDYQCECMGDVPYGTPGTYQSIAYSMGYVWVASYNERYGDLMLARTSTAGLDGAVIKPWQWSFMDGVPDGPVSFPGSDIRGGVIIPGEDVGRYVSLVSLGNSNLLAAYHNATLGALRIGHTTDGTSWTSYDLDDGGDPSGPDMGDAGLYADAEVAPDGKVGVAYAVKGIQGSANLVSEIRLARARTDIPQSASDWDIVSVGRLEYPYSNGSDQVDDWPQGALFVKLHFFGDGRAAVSWYDQYQGALHFAYQTSVGGDFQEVTVVQGDGYLGMGLFASFDIDPMDENQIHFVYQDERQQTLRYALLNLNSLEVQTRMLDDGFREDDGANAAGLPEPVQHWFGSDSRIVVDTDKIYVAWQDATTDELYLGILDRADQSFTEQVISSLRTGPVDGSKGFFVDMFLQQGSLYISSYGVNLKAEPDILGNPPVDHFVEIFHLDTGVVE